MIPLVTTTAATLPRCPAGMTRLDSFKLHTASWSVCEDLQQPGGAERFTVREYYGALTLRRGLELSRNTMTVRLAQGVAQVVAHHKEAQRV